MKEADVILTPLPQADGPPKNRPALILRELPPFGDFLVCGISAQVHQAIPGFDEVVSRADADFAGSGLLVDSVIRLGFLAVLPRKKLLGGWEGGQIQARASPEESQHASTCRDHEGSEPVNRARC